MVNDGDYYKGRACAYCSEPDVAKEYYHCPECDVMIKFGSWLVCLDLSAGNVGIAPINDLCHLFFFYDEEVNSLDKGFRRCFSRVIDSGIGYMIYDG